MRNKELMKKADLALSSLSTGGLLNPAQARTFIRKLIKSPTIINQARVYEMTSPQQNIDKIGFGSRIMRSAASVAPSGTAMGQSDRAAPTTSQIVLTAKEVIAEVWLPYDVLEDNIERAEAAGDAASNVKRGGLHNTLISMIGERCALDLEELAISGDTGSGDAYLALNNGWLKIGQSLGNIVDMNNAAITKAMFKAGNIGMPDQYLRNKRGMRHFVSVDQETNYRDYVADRATGSGDRALETDDALKAFGSPINAVPMMPDAKGLFTDPLNLIFGIWRNISMEFDRDISARVYKIVLTARVDFKVEEPEALVYYRNIA